MSNAFTSSIIDLKLVETLIVLIPKIDNPSHMHEFKPIGLCNVLYKIIAKVLVNRIRPFLKSLLDPYKVVSFQAEVSQRI